jgi:hypothetical protein
MLDDFSLLSSTFCILYVFWRAALLDKALPWFEREAAPQRKAASSREAVPAGKTAGNRKDAANRYWPF